MRQTESEWKASGPVVMESSDIDRSDNATALRTPPGPGGRLNLALIREEPLRFLAEDAARYGDIWHYRTNRGNVVVVNRPEYVKHVLEDNNTNYLKTGTPEVMMFKPVVGNSVMTTDGAPWLRQRRLAQPAFRRDRIHGLDTLMTDAVQSMLRGWELAASSGEPLEVEVEMTRLTLNIVTRALFEFDISGEGSRFEQVIHAMKECMARFDPGNSALLQRFTEGQRAVRSLVQKIIAHRRGHTGEDPGDLLSIFLKARDDDGGRAMTDRQMQDEIVTLLLAGHETTAKALTWTFYVLDQHPQVADRLRAELRDVLGGRLPTADDLPRLPVTSMIIDESMRLYPPAWLMSRMCRADDAIDGYCIRAGTLVAISPYLLHRHTRYWTNPDVFDLDHFAPAAAATRPAYTYCPFSGGPRLCMGRHFAGVETRLVLATITQRFSLQLVPGHAVEPEALVSLRPRYGMPMHIRRVES